MYFHFLFGDTEHLGDFLVRLNLAIILEAFISACMTIALAFLIVYRLALLIKRAHFRKGLHDDREEQIQQEEATDNYQNREIDGCD